ncbi:tight junction protein ZO-2 [Eurytemora carolleeae]|uniref:tight junction protein ZO-2 n=1 Tax=Eurytemora carolleeae TaxID=1294199 RepID=UPI000C790056|nr:tight junction protein ZO-2 [Eurytemora carolleeae]|eukprot:XP_023324267.1 tight junction protein ZO-2-like [Eurytemora affinis]
MSISSFFGIKRDRDKFKRSSYRASKYSGRASKRGSGRASKRSIKSNSKSRTSTRRLQGYRTKKAGERIAWELHHVTLNRVSGFGFGIAVSGGRDNPHFSNGDTSIAISDVLKGGPAEGKLMINDRVISANKISLEGVDYATAVQVLRDSGQSVNLVVKRRIVLPAPPEPQNIRVSLVKTKKKDDFGIVLGCKIYIKEISGRSLADKEGSLQVGDLIQKLNSLSVDGLSLKETRKVLESAKEKLEITVQRDPYRSPLKTDAAESRLGENLYSSPPRKDGKGRYEETTPPSRPPPPKESESSSLSEATTLPIGEAQPREELAREVLAREELAREKRISRDFDSSRPQQRESVDYGITPRNKDDASHSSKSKTNLPDPRFISFQKDGSVGIRLTGGNDSGIFVTAVQPGSPAAQQGLQPGDKIIKVNDMDMSGVTREEAVLYLLSLQDQIDLIVQYRKEEYEQIVQNQRGDSFYIKAHFNYEQPDKGEMTFKKCDVFHVVDTLHNGVVGAWQAFRMDPFLSGLGRAAEQVQKGVIPNKSRAEEIATKQFNAAKKEQSVSEQNKGSFFKRKRTQNHRRSKSLGKDHWEDLVWSESMSKFPAYERVSLRHPGFPRPVVIFGAVADIARERLLRDFPLKFASPQQDSSASLGSGAGLENKKSGIVRLSAIRDIMERGLHALLDVTPNAVDKLNYAQFYPIVLLARADSKQTIKECRAGLPKRAHLPSRKLLEQSQKIEKLWGHSLTGTLHLHADNWYNKITDLIEKQQTAPIWMSDAKPVEFCSDVFLLPLGSPPQDYLDSEDTDFESPPVPPPLDPEIYDMLLKSIDNKETPGTNRYSRQEDKVEHFI